jgi:HlyD family secretion protein
MRCTAWLAAALGLAGCDREPGSAILGATEWDRVELVAEVSEPVVAIAVREGDAVAAGQTLVELDARRPRAELAAADAEIARLTALLAQQHHGARPEAVAEARARVRRAQGTAANAAQEAARARALRAKGLNSAADLDRAVAAEVAAQGDLDAARAALELVLAGTRAEEIEQTEAALDGARARRDAAQLVLERATVRAPRYGRVDAIPVEVGDQPARGATLVTLLVGDAAHARVYVPERVRATLAPRARFRVDVEGVAQPFAGTLRWISAEASFTPYYALTGEDASRLVYLAEIDLEGPGAAQLAAGLPLVAKPEAPR